MKIIYILLTVSLLTSNLYSQIAQWHVLPNAPNSHSRFEDIFFVNPGTGWIVNLSGNIYRTTNGGSNWQSQGNNQSQNRSLGFFNSDTGIIGTLLQTKLLFRTTNSGVNWTDITASVSGPLPFGICGLSIVNSTVAYGCGRYNGPAMVIKTTNAGANWTSTAIDTSLARSLVDCLFWTPDSGIVVGGYSSSNVFSVGNSVILMTTNGGSSWNRVYLSSRTHEWCWKISFISRQIGYVSIEGGTGGLVYYLKTTNGGLNWTDKPFINNYDEEGIGFVNENTGWLGGHGNGITDECYETTDGGSSWHLGGWGKQLNRIRFLSDTLAYACGDTIYKYTSEPIGIQTISTEVPKQFLLHQNYPNPFNPETKIRFDIPSAGAVPRTARLIIYNSLGQEITTLVNEHLKAGIFEISWNAANYPSGVYFYKLQTENFSDSKKLILIK